MKVAALDLGSNTFLLLIAEANKKNEKLNVLYDACRVTRLSEGVNQTGKINEKALLRADKCFAEFVQVIKSYSVDKIAGVATSAARDAENSRDFFKLAESYNIPVEIISGTREAELTFRGALLGKHYTEGTCVVDVGGGSTEIIGIQNGVIRGQSLNLGSVRLTEMFIKTFPTPKTEISELEAYIDKNLLLCREKLPLHIKSLVAVAGTPTTLASLAMGAPFTVDRVEGFVVTAEMLDEWIEKIRALSLDERLKLTGMDPGREDVIVAGLCILRKTLEFFKLNEMKVSTRGVRFGLAASLLEAL